MFSRVVDSPPLLSPLWAVTKEHFRSKHILKTLFLHILLYQQKHNKKIYSMNYLATVYQTLVSTFLFQDHQFLKLYYQSTESSGNVKTTYHKSDMKFLLYVMYSI